MRVLWFTHLPLDAVNRHFGRPTTGTGFWIHSLVSPLIESGRVDLAIVTATAGDPPYRFTESGVKYFNIPQNKFLEVFGLFGGYRRNGYLREAASIIEAWKPDIIHVHGTERFFGLVRARNLTRVPTVVSIQTIMAEYARWAWGSMAWGDILRNTTLWELSRNATMPADAYRHWRQACVERQILNSMDGVLGRTAWDRSHVRLINPSVPYFHVDDMMRPEFRLTEPWSLQSVRRGSLITTSSPGAAKGVAVLLRALHALRRWGHDVRLKIAGVSRVTGRRASDRYLFKLVDDLELDGVVEFLGWCEAKELVDHQRQSHCFVTPSFIENGCNALSEAQLLGMPCVASHAGGLTTTIRDGQTGLLFSRGDPAMLAAKVEAVLLDDGLAVKIGAAARVDAQLRHEPARIVSALLDAYHRVAQTRQ